MNVVVGDDADECCLNGMEAGEETKLVINKSSQSADPPVWESAPCSQSGVTSYGKSNFILPVTFFDIQSNLNFLNECCPLSINIVDCNKHPWYYKKYIRTDLETESLEESDSIPHASDNQDNKDCISIDLTQNMYDKFENVSYKDNGKPNEIKMNTAQKARLKKYKRLKKIALSRMNLSKIDFKRNKGLIGLKITHRLELISSTDNACKVDDVNLSQNPTDPSKCKAEEQIGCDLEKYISVVDKALCNLGTSITPIINNPLYNTKVSSELKLNTGNICGKSNTENICKSMFSTCTDSKIVATKKSTQNDTSKFCNPSIMAAKKQSKAKANKESKQIIITPTPSKNKKRRSKKKTTEPAKHEYNSNNGIISIKEPEKITEADKIASKEINKVEHVRKEELKVLNDKMNICPARSKSPVFSINVKPLTPHSNNSKRANEDVKTNESYTKEQSATEFTITPSQNERIRTNSKPVKNIQNKEHVHKYTPSTQPNNQTKKIGRVHHDANSNKNIITIVPQEPNKNLTNGNLNNHVTKTQALSNPAGSTPSIQQTLLQNRCKNVSNQNTTHINVVKNTNRQNQQVKHQSPQQMQMSVRANVRKNCPGHLSNMFASRGPHLGLFRPPGPRITDTSYNNNMLRHSAPHTYHNNFQQNMNTPQNTQAQNIPRQNFIMGRHSVGHNILQQNVNFPQTTPPHNTGNPEMYWPWYPQKPALPVMPPPMPPPPPLLPPPPPPLPEKHEVLQQNVVQTPVDVGSKVMKKINILARTLTAPNNSKPPPNYTSTLNSVNSNTLLREKYSGNSQRAPEDKVICYNNAEVPSAQTAVSSKSEMFQELQKETLKIDNEISTTKISNEVQNQPKSIQMPVYNNETVNTSQVINPNVSNGLLHQETNYAHNTAFSLERKMSHAKSVETHSTNEHKDSFNDWKKQNDGGKKPLNQCDHKKASPQTNETPSDKSRVGPLCMKNKTGPFAKHDISRLTHPHTPITEKSPPRKLYSPPRKGYSPPILPIPTFQKSLEMLTQVNDSQKHAQLERNTPNIPKNLPKLLNEVQKKRNHREKHEKDKLAYFYIDKEKKALKKISLQDYQNRVTNADGNYIVVKKNNSCKRAKRNESSEQDLGYDSDATVKL